MESEKKVGQKFEVDAYSEIIKSFGVRGIKAQEVISLDDLEFEEFKQVYGVFFLCKWHKRKAAKEKPSAYAPELFFANQVTLNDAPTQALLSVLMNSQEIVISDALKGLKKFTAGLDPRQKGAALENSEVFSSAKIRKAQKIKATFHYISFVPYKGKVYELDGMEEGPLLVGVIDEGKEWIYSAKAEIQKIIDGFTKAQMRYHFVALIPDQKEIAEASLQRDLTLRAEVEKRLSIEADVNMIASNDAEKYKAYLDRVPTDKGELQALYKSLNISIAQSQGTILLEEEKARKWKEENEKRRHNYIPFLLEMLKILDKKGTLGAQIQKAIEEASLKASKKVEIRRPEEKKP